MNLTDSSPNAAIFDSAGNGTIVNDDQVPQVSIDNVNLNEGNSGTTNSRSRSRWTAPRPAP